MTVSLIQDTNVRACLPYNYDNEDYIEKDREYVFCFSTLPNGFISQTEAVCLKFDTPLVVHDC